MNCQASHHSDMRKALLRTRMEQAPLIDNPIQPMLDVHGMRDNLKTDMQDYSQQNDRRDIQALEKENEYRELLRSLLQMPGITPEMRKDAEVGILHSVAETKRLEKVIQERRPNIRDDAAGPSTGGIHGNKKPSHY